MRILAACHDVAVELFLVFSIVTFLASFIGAGITVLLFFTIFLISIHVRV